MKIYLLPKYRREDAGEGGIRRVVEAQQRYLPEMGVEFVEDIAQADLVHVHAAEYVETDRPLVLSTHGLYWAGYNWPNWAYQANARIIRTALRADAITAPSEWVANSLRRGGLFDPVVCYHGIDPAEFEPQTPSDYVFWGKNRTDPICTPEYLMQLAARAPNVKFISTFGKPAANLSIIGLQPHRTIKAVLQRAYIYLATTMETFGVQTLEAMAYGIPVLGFAWGGQREIVRHGETGYLAKAGDMDDLVRGLQFCIEQRDSLGQAARQHVLDRFRWEQTIPFYMKAYQQALEANQVDRPLVSVIVTAYNLEQYLPACLDSVLVQDTDDWELIVVDDASPDRCGEIAETYAQRDSRIKVIHNSHNLYLAEARNVGIRAARGRFILPLDADDRITPSALRVLASALRGDHDISIATGAMAVFEEGGDQQTGWVSGWPGKEPSYEQQIMKRNQVPYASMYRRTVWERTGGYRRRMRTCEDADFWTRAMSFGAAPAKVTDLPTLLYLNRKSSMSHSIPEAPWRDWFPWAHLPSLTPFTASGRPIKNLPSWPVPAYGPPKVSVVIPCGRGHETYLQDALDSLVAQTFQEWEVIVVNDTGYRWLDADGHKIVPYLDGFPFVRLLDSQGPVVGVAAARNRGIEAAQAPLFVLLDADDYAQPLFLELLYKAQVSVGGWVYSDWRDQDGEHKQARDWEPDELTRRMLGASTAIYPKAAWAAVGGIDEDIPGWEDWSFQLSLLEAGICGSHLAEPLFTYRYQTGRRREESLDRRDEVLQYITKKHSKLWEDSIMAGCRKCGGGGGRKALNAGIAQRSAGVSPQASYLASQSDMVLVEYTGPQTQSRTVKSKVMPGRHYMFGGPPGAETRRQFVYTGDADWLTGRSDYRLIALPPAEDSGLAEPLPELPVLKAETQLPPPGTDWMPLSLLDVKSEIISIVEANGFVTIGDIRRAPTGQLLTLKGMGPRRAKEIKEAADAFV